MGHGDNIQLSLTKREIIASSQYIKISGTEPEEGQNEIKVEDSKHVDEEGAEGRIYEIFTSRREMNNLIHETAHEKFEIKLGDTNKLFTIKLIMIN